MDEKLVSAAMEIILNAGDARKLISEAGNEVAKFNTEAADEKLEQAHKCILLAHKCQTNLIQKEADGETTQPSLLFNHAQDTLMVTTSEFNCTKQLNNLTKSLITQFGIKKEG